MPAKYKSQPWARLGVNVDEDFEPLYIISPDKKSTVSELKGLLKDVDELYLATDGDREGEAIAWHLLETLKPRIPVKRMVFHEITEPAILEAAENPRDLDNDLVDAQETRRILDRLYGYEVSPVLWKKVAPKLSAEKFRPTMTTSSTSCRKVCASQVTTADGPPRIAVGRLIRSSNANAYAQYILPTACVMTSATLVLNRLIDVPRGGSPPPSPVGRRAAR